MLDTHVTLMCALSTSGMHARMHNPERRRQQARNKGAAKISKAAPVGGGSREQGLGPQDVVTFAYR